ncbi:MAG TPA: dihydrolipoamide acyltransferase [Flavobacteriales bacterium]|nr:dihydrolipoamide acyltransferase [Flavobacteriales bacterium]HCA82268.1 dihydrolipoamide acyltransferase [Flavobacteriales bacterium]HRE75463.1 dihydrolipoamide acetyltransferase family protein [Flavobacteriales bacterium]HRE96115.1 dihydrolipoamide acetyltransferase family protein [Flavobacteriales bacterium]HRJ34988.1 dihydrolipoamide acetyltransferase family protein [Flavobacteriales bacterium]
MAEIIRMPKLSDTMTEGVVAQWHKKVGDAVKSGELLADIETDKATMEFESYQNGVLLHIGVEKGKGAPVDSILAILGKQGEDISALLEEEKKKAVAPQAEVKAELPVAKEEPVKIAAEAPKTVSAPVQKTVKTSAPVANANGRTKISPLAKRLAEEKGLNPNLLQGSGDGGRIVKRDIENFGGMGMMSTGVESYTEVAVSQMRKTIARRLAESKFTAPHFYLTLEIDMDRAIDARKAIADISGVKVSFNDMVIKAAALALKKHPAVNSSWLGDRIRYNQHVHMGVAVAVEDGLLVPVVRFADTKPLSQISAEVRDYAQKAKDKKLQPSDWEGNTFTISNLGMFGIEEFTAIINPPDACILAVGGIKQVPVVKNGAVVPGNIMKVTLSCDHRVVDGATGAAFLNHFKQLMENPAVMLGQFSI